VRKIFYKILISYGLLTHILPAQKTDTLCIFFDIDKYETVLNPSYRKHAENFLNDQTLDSLVIHAYTDFMASDAYNITLSRKRAEFGLYIVKEIRKGIQDSVKVRMQWFGEKFSSPNGKKEGDAFWRRCDIIGYFHIPIASEKSEEKKSTPITASPPKRNEHPNRCSACEEKLLKMIEKTKVNDTLILEGIEFVPGKHKFLVKSYPVLNALKRAMIEYPDLKIEIQGHVCCQYESKTDGLDLETGEYALSLNRAKAVRDWLYKNGNIDTTRMKYVGFAGKYPKVYPEITEDDKQKNRRVEIKIIQK
jgi:outer membrane protein OmpA-like peptidoglycan-associated protein